MYTYSPNHALGYEHGGTPTFRSVWQRAQQQSERWLARSIGRLMEDQRSQPLPPNAELL